MFSKTVDGIEMDLWDLDPQVVTVEHIANVLARINRYAGHWVHPISVARHCLTLTGELKFQGFSVGVQLQGLMHDASEAYTLDIPTPLKDQLMIELPAVKRHKHAMFPAIRNTISYRAFEDDLLERIFKQLGIPWPLNPAVLLADHAAIKQETPVIQGRVKLLHTTDPATVALLFIARAKDLMNKCGIPYV